MYERRHEKVISREEFIRRVLHHLGMTAPIILLSLVVGIAGYRYLEDMTWVDAFLNAAMIMSGMGPAGELHTNAGKIFASCYALYSGLFLIAVTGFLLIPFFHRVLHKFHQEND